MIGYPLFFQIDNDRDSCDFCHRKGKLIKALTTGKCICPQCIEHVAANMVDDPLLLPMHQPVEE